MRCCWLQFNTVQAAHFSKFVPCSSQRFTSVLIKLTFQWACILFCRHLFRTEVRVIRRLSGDFLLWGILWIWLICLLFHLCALKHIQSVLLQYIKLDLSESLELLKVYPEGVYAVHTGRWILRHRELHTGHLFCDLDKLEVLDILLECTSFLREDLQGHLTRIDGVNDELLNRHQILLNKTVFFLQSIDLFLVSFLKLGFPLKTCSRFSCPCVQINV